MKHACIPRIDARPVKTHLGWSKDSIKPGDTVTITCNPHKTPGATACLTKELIVNGNKLPMGPIGQPAPQTQANKE